MRIAAVPTKRRPVRLSEVSSAWRSRGAHVQAPTTHTHNIYIHVSLRSESAGHASACRVQPTTSRLLCRRAVNELRTRLDTRVERDTTTCKEKSRSLAYCIVSRLASVRRLVANRTLRSSLTPCSYRLQRVRLYAPLVIRQYAQSSHSNMRTSIRKSF